MNNQKPVSAVASASRPSPQYVGQEFVRQYYTLLNKVHTIQ